MIRGKTRLCLALLVVYLTIASSPPCARAASVRLCGEKLVKMVLTMCNNCLHGVYADGFSVKSKRLGMLTVVSLVHVSVPGSLPMESSPESSDFDQPVSSDSNSDENGGDSYPDLLPELVGRSRAKRGIVDDCCLRQCSYSSLKSYCCKAN